MFSLKKRKYKRKSSRGFTLVELLVVLGIFVIFSTVILARHTRFNNDVLLTNLAYDVAGSIRKAQVFGLSVREISGTPGEFNRPYGVVFDSVLSTGDNPEEFHLGADLSGNGRIEDAEILETFKLTRDIKVSMICATKTAHGNCESTSIHEINFLFLRPDPEAIIETKNGDDKWIYAEIHISAPDGNERVISVSDAGQIVVRQ